MTEAVTLFVTDPTVLVRPRTAPPSQYPGNAKHDVARTFEILDLGTDEEYVFHIISPLRPAATHALLDDVLHYFVDGCCHDQWCDAIARYRVGGDTAMVKEYGFDDGSYTMIFEVYCEVTDREAFLAELLAKEQVPAVIVRPDTSDPRGYHVQYVAELQPAYKQG